MALADLVSARLARTETRSLESRYSADTWLSQFLIPATQQFGYGGHSYPYGVNTTYSRIAVQEIANDLPGYMSAVRSCPPAFAAQMVRALVLSQVRFMFRNPPSHRTNPRRLFGTRALGVLEHPWPNATTGELVARMEWHAGLAGNAYVTNYDPDRLRVLRPDWVVIVYGSQQEPEQAAHALDGHLLGYMYAPGGLVSTGMGLSAAAGGRIYSILPEQMAHWSPIPDPECAGIGMSWLTPAIRDIQGDVTAAQHKVQFFSNAATPNLVIKGLTPMNGGAFTTKAQFDEVVDMLEAGHRGVGNAYKTLYLTAGADASVIGSNMQQIDFKATVGTGETRISVLSRVPAAVLGISEGLAGSALNAGNFGQARRGFSATWVYPTLQDLCAALAPLVRVPDDAELWFDPGDMALLHEDAKDLAEIIKEQALAIESLTRAGFKADASVRTVQGNDIGQLLGQHSGLYSVQMQPAGPDPNNPGAPAELDLTRPGQTPPSPSVATEPAAPTSPQEVTVRHVVDVNVNGTHHEVDLGDEERAGFRKSQLRWSIEDILEGIKVGGRWKPSGMFHGKRRRALRASSQRLRRRLLTAATQRSHADIVEALTAHPEEHVRGIHRQLHHRGSKSKPIATVRDEVAASLLKRELELRYPTPPTVKPTRTKVRRPRGLPQAKAQGSGRDFLDEMEHEPTVLDEPIHRPHSGTPEPGTQEYDDMVDRLLEELATGGPPAPLTGSVEDLRRIAAKEGVPIPAGAKREQIIALIREYRAVKRALRSAAFRSGDEIRRYNPAQKRIPAGNVGGGRWRDLSTIIVGLLKDWASGKGHDDPLKDFNRDQLRRFAKEHDIPLRRGAQDNEVKNAILDAVRRHGVKETPAPVKAAKKAAPAAPRAPRKATPRGRGRDMLADADSGEVARRVIADSRQYKSGEVADPMLSAIAHHQGFDGKPKVVSSAEMDRLHADGKSVRLLRGHGAQMVGRDQRGKTPEEIHEQLRTGTAHYGLGGHGNGYYFASGDLEDAARLYGGGEGSTVRATLAPDARVAANLDELGWREFAQEHGLYHRGVRSDTDEARVFHDMGRYAAARGFDAYWVNPGHEMVVLNRTKLIVEDPKIHAPAARPSAKAQPNPAGTNLHFLTTRDRPAGAKHPGLAPQGTGRKFDEFERRWSRLRNSDSTDSPEKIEADMRREAAGMDGPEREYFTNLADIIHTWRTGKAAPAARVPAKKAAPTKATGRKVRGRDLLRDESVTAEAFEAGKENGEWGLSGGIGSQRGGRWAESGGYQAHLAIARRQGFDALPRVLTGREGEPDSSRLEAEGYIPLYRGWGWGGRATASTGREQAAQYLYGPLHAGGGHGLGTNMSSDIWAADYYSSSSGIIGDRDPNGHTAGFLLRPDAKVASYPKIKAEHERYLASLGDGPEHEAERKVYEDVGTYAMARGYDAMVVRPGESILVREGRPEEWVIFNRSALVAFDDDGELKKIWDAKHPVAPRVSAVEKGARPAAPKSISDFPPHEQVLARDLVRRYETGVSVAQLSEDHASSLPSGRLSQAKVRELLTASGVDLTRRPAASPTKKARQFDPDSADGRLEDALSGKSPQELRRIAHESNIDLPATSRTKPQMILHIIQSAGQHDRRIGGGDRSRQRVADIAGRTTITPAGPPNIKETAARLRSLDSQGDIVHAIDGPQWSAAKLRELSDELGIDVPPRITRKPELQMHIASELRGGRSLGAASPVGAGRHPAKAMSDQERRLREQMGDVDFARALKENRVARLAALAPHGRDEAAKWFEQNMTPTQLRTYATSRNVATRRPISQLWDSNRVLTHRELAYEVAAHRARNGDFAAPRPLLPDDPTPVVAGRPAKAAANLGPPVAGASLTGRTEEDLRKIASAEGIAIPPGLNAKEIAKLISDRRRFLAAPNPGAVVQQLRAATSVEDGRAILAGFKSKADLQALARAAGVEYSSGDSIARLREMILRQLVTRRLEHAGYLGRVQSASLEGP